MRTEFTSQGGGRKKEKKKNNEKSDNRCTQEHTEIGLSSNLGVRPVRDNCSGARARNGAVMRSEIRLYNVNTSISTLLIVRTRVNNTTTSKYCNDINAGFSADKLITIEVVNRRQRGQERNTPKSCYPALSPYPHQVCTHTRAYTHTYTRSRTASDSSLTQPTLVPPHITLPPLVQHLRQQLETGNAELESSMASRLETKKKKRGG